MSNFNFAGESKVLMEELEDISDKMKVTKTDDYSYVIEANRGESSVIFKIITDDSSIMFGIEYKSYFSQRIGTIINIMEDLCLSGDKDLQHKFDTIQCENNKCPVCNSEMILNFMEQSCSNKCYSISPLFGKYTIQFDAKLFTDQPFEIYPYMKMKDKIKVINELYDSINYWKEDDKYLIKILSKGDA
ncbi:gp465 [Bacillus phage G]|uniref:Gp465 n=1 Tax=Bacillus phage G TaxID=2884420 RepID=G3MAK6_9CAUD|nr:gp465 [Bacillus phage G]AEO93723.1 gp465 [Bacillus phage G]